ncbi:MAG: sigma-70 family RNA polymerase sigma factor [Acidobacteria bacterium]|nr:sigma-70 family RNA polymerase sigma factor [Acidobacteriota bacterium]
MTAQAPAGAQAGDEDQPLVERSRAGDVQAFGLLVEKYQHRIVNVARALLPRPDEAEDVAQEVFLRAFQGLRGFRGGSLFRTWLYRIAANTARTHVSRRRDRREDAPGDDVLAEMPSPADVERALVDRDRVNRALAAVPIEFREVLVLRDIEGLDYREIAAALSLPIGTVESRLFRGRQRLRAALLGTETDHDT